MSASSRRADALMRKVPFHPVVLASSFALVNVVETGVHVAASGRVMIIAIGGTLGLQLLVAGLLRDRHLGSALATGLLAIVCFFLPIRFALEAILLAPPWQTLILAGLAGALVVVSQRIGWPAVRLRREPTVTRALNTFAAVLLGVVAISVALSPFPGQTVRDLQSADTAPTAVLPGVGAQGAPNIYLVILDGHPRRDALLEITGQDTGAFEAELRREGLQVAASAHSNYAWTGATLGSMLNFVPIDSLPAGAPAWAPADSSESRQIRNAVNDSAAFSLLRTAGYRVIAVGPPWEHVALRSADEFIDVGYLNSLECHLLSRTALGAVAWAIEPDLIGDRRREGVERSLETLVSVASRDSAQAQFVVVHVPAPHLPVLWDDKGRPVSDTAGNDCAPPGVPGLSGAALRSAYAASLRHLHLLVSQAVAGVVATDEDAVVVVLSDHGARLGEPADELTEGQEWRDTFGVLLAARTPGQPGIVPDDVSLVNLLSILFNAYLEADIPFQANDTQWHDGTPAEAP